MSKYIKLEDALKGLNIGYGKYDYVSKVAEYYHDLPTIEVNEDCISRKALLKQIYADSEGKEGGYGDEWEFIDTINKLKPAAAKGTYIKSIYLSSTMSQGVKVDPKSVDEA